MIKSIVSMALACVLGGGVLFGTVDATTEQPRTPQIVDMTYENEQADTLDLEKEVPLKTKNKRSVKKAVAKEQVAEVKATTPMHQHNFVAIYKTIKEQTGTETVIHYYCYRCKADITYEDIDAHLEACGTDMYTSKKLQEPVYAEKQVVDYWECECGARQ